MFYFITFEYFKLISYNRGSYLNAMTNRLIALKSTDIQTEPRPLNFANNLDAYLDI